MIKKEETINPLNFENDICIVCPFSKTSPSLSSQNTKLSTHTTEGGERGDGEKKNLHPTPDPGKRCRLYNAVIGMETLIGVVARPMGWRQASDASK